MFALYMWYTANFGVEMGVKEQIDRIERGEHMSGQDDSRSISTGSELLDLIIGGGGWGPFGKVVNIIGDSSSGKTFVACEAIYQGKKILKDKLKIRYNDAESGFNFNTMDLYGYSMTDYLTQTPTIESFASDLQQFCKTINVAKGEYGIYVVDSFDGLASDADIEEFDKRLDAHEKGKTYDKGSYDMSKQKFSSKLFRTLSQTIESSNVLLIIISQIRDNIGVSFGQQWKISGGQALKFYSTIRLFLQSVDKFIVEDRQIGYTVKCTGMKVRSKHPYREAIVNILFEYGLDNVSTNIDYIYDLRDNFGKLKEASVINNIAWKDTTVEVNSQTMKAFLSSEGLLEEAEEVIKSEGNRMTQKNITEWISRNKEVQNKFVEHFGVLDRESLIQYVISNGLEKEMAKRAVDKWLAIEERIKPVRTRKTLEG